MADTLTQPALRPAFEVQPGSVVVLEIDDGPAAFIKVERIGKEYIHHYAIQIHPRGEGPLGMVYLDPDDPVFDTAMSASFSFGETASGAPQSGHVFENASGYFIKVDEDPKSQKMHGFIECATGIVRRRQERGVAAVYAGWCAHCERGGQTVAIEQAFELFRQSKA